MTLVADLEPVEMAANVNNTTPGALVDTGQRWLSLRDELAVLGSIEGGVFALRAGELAGAINGTYGRLIVVAESQQRGTDRVANEHEILEAVRRHHDEALKVGAELLSMIHSTRAAERG
jgi:hypothetical protein